MSRVRVRRHVRRRQREAPIARSTISYIPPHPFSKRVITVVTPRGKTINVMATVLGGGGGSENIAIESPHTPIRVAESALKENVASTMDDLFEFDIVPPTVLRLVGNEAMATQTFVEGAGPLYDYLEGLDPEDYREEIPDRMAGDILKIVLFDLIVGHVDRHTGNIVVKGGRAYAIDNENIFGSPSVERPGISTVHSVQLDRPSYYDIVEGMTIPESVQRKIRNVTKEDFVTAAAGLPRDAVEDAWERKEWIETWVEIPHSDMLASEANRRRLWHDK